MTECSELLGLIYVLLGYLVARDAVKVAQSYNKNGKG